MKRATLGIALFTLLGFWASFLLHDNNDDNFIITYKWIMQYKNFNVYLYNSFFVFPLALIMSYGVKRQSKWLWVFPIVQLVLFVIVLAVAHYFYEGPLQMYDYTRPDIDRGNFFVSYGDWANYHRGHLVLLYAHAYTRFKGWF